MKTRERIAVLAAVLLLAGLPAFAQSWAGHGRLQEQKYADARAQYQKALAQLDKANQAPVLRGVAVTYYAEKNLPQAIDTLKQVLVLTPDDTQSVQLLVNWLVESGHEEEAKAYMAKLPQGATVDPNTILNLGIK